MIIDFGRLKCVSFQKMSQLHNGVIFVFHHLMFSGKNAYSFKNVVMKGKKLVFVLEIPVVGFRVINLIQKYHLQLVG